MGVPVLRFQKSRVFPLVLGYRANGKKSKSAMCRGACPGMGFGKSRIFIECLSTRGLGLSESEIRFSISPTGTENANFKVPEMGVGAWRAPYAVSHLSGFAGSWINGYKIGTKNWIAESETS